VAGMKKVSMKIVWFVLTLSLIIVMLLEGGCRFKPEDERIQATGTIEMTETTVSSKSNGRVISIAVEEGQSVNQGDLLVKLDHEELDAQIASARANLDVAIANYDSAKTDLQRNKLLYKDQLISSAQFDQVATKSDVTKAQVGQAKSNLDLLKVQLSNVEILAPGSGIISAKLIENGELVSSGTSLFTLLDYDKPWVKIYLPLKEVSSIKLNDRAYVQLDAFPDKKFYGRISYISKEAEFTPKDFLSKDERIKQVFAVKIELTNKEGLIKAGLPVDVWVMESN
jgi:HlyD family secretion protein